MSSTKVISIVGSRHRSPNNPSGNIDLINKIVQEVRLDPANDNFTIMSLGCDKGFGKDVKDYCNEQGIKFAEILIWFNGPRTKEEYNDLFLSRNSAIAQAGSMFYLAISSKRVTQVEDLLAKVKLLGKPFKVYDEVNQLVEYET